MPDERRQFRLLYRDFLARLIDLEILSTRGDSRDLVARIGGLLGGLSFVLAYVMGPHPHPVPGLWNDEEFLLSTTIAVAGFFAVFSWNSVFPDKRECLILGPAPVRTRTIALAKLAAVSTGICLAIAMTNLFTGMLFPFVDGVRWGFPAWWFTLFLAGAFVLTTTLALQGIAAQVLTWRAFLRISGPLQLLLLFTVLVLFFITPPFALTVRQQSGLIPFLPSFWFTGLYEVLKGSRNPAFLSLAAMAVRNAAVAGALAAVTFALAYYRNMRRIVEAPDIATAGLRGLTRIANLLAKTFLSKPLDRAIVLFTARTIARSRQHRLLLAAYGGIGFALSVAFAKSLLEGTSPQHWYEPNVPLLVAGATLVLSAVGGTRAVFVFPHALPANWMFRITAIHNPAAYFSAVRKALIVLGAVPAWIVASAAYASLWPARIALAQTAMLVALGFLLVDKSLYQFRKIPFTCSWLPDGAQSKMRTVIYGIVFILIASIAGSIELWTLQRLARFVTMLAILSAIAVGAARRRAEFASAAGISLQFDDVPPSEIHPLDLRADGEWSGEQAYADAIDPHFGRSFFVRRVKPAAIGLFLLLTVGAVYERLAEWRDGKRFPQVGQRFDIGGRSLNMLCTGAGSPAVIFESASGSPGTEWMQVQREVAKFSRACWYDRAGLGWSDSAPHLNPSDSIARDLHALLRASGTHPPYVLVGHSEGGYHVRVFRSFYPAEVKGMVLVDLPHETASAQPPLITIPPRTLVHIVEALGRVGLVRIFAPDAPEFRWQAIAARINEGPDSASTQNALPKAELSDIPLVVLTTGHGPRRDTSGTVVEAVRDVLRITRTSTGLRPDSMQRRE